MYQLDLQLALSRTKEMQCAAERERLAAQAAASQPGATDRAAMAAGAFLVEAGLRLEHWAQTRHAPMRPRGAH